MSIVATEALIRELPVEKIRGLQKATVVADFDPTTNVRVVMDSETAESLVMSAVGELQADQRVLVLFTEPHGAYIMQLLHPPAWRPAAALFNAGWSNYAAGYAEAAYRLVGDVVELRGLLARSAGGSTSPFVLPVGFRPPGHLIFATDVTNAHTRFNVQSDGTVDFPVIGAGAISWVSLSPGRFSVTADPA